MEITPFRSDYSSDAAALFVQNYKALRRSIPVLPDLMEDHDRVAERLDRLMDSCPGVAALEGGTLVGYMGWYQFDNCRETGRRAAFCPEWAHGAADGAQPAIYRALYRAASAQWAAAGCQVHGISLLAHDREAERIWFWNGFGLTVVDAIRSLAPLESASPAGFIVRKATPDDVDLLAILDAEHWRHYAQPPVFMVPQPPGDAARFADLLSCPTNSVWLAMQGDEAMGFMRFEGSSDGAADVVSADTTVAITGAYIRPAYRGRRAAACLLDAALRDYAGQGAERCSVDFESFNPEAAVFWMKYFEPVCLSVLRVPESMGLLD
jgi:ribosomal protein S18 acetylase RimI-like enzyme